MKRSADGPTARGSKIQAGKTNGWRFDLAERKEMAKEFARVYAECEQLIGSHTHNFKTVQ